MLFVKDFLFFSACGSGFVVGCLGFLSSSQSRALCALHKPARSVRSPGHSPFRNPLAWLWGRRRKPCVKQRQNGSVLALFVAVNGRRKSFRRKLHRSENWTKWNNFVKNYETKLHSSEPDVIQDSAPHPFLFSHQRGMTFVLFLHWSSIDTFFFKLFVLGFI